MSHLLLSRVNALLAPGSVYLSWLVIAFDATGKRAAVECRECGAKRQVGAGALIDGTLHGCGCRAGPTRSSLACLDREKKREGGIWQRGRNPFR
jgi:hypothetical protein